MPDHGAGRAAARGRLWRPREQRFLSLAKIALIGEELHFLSSRPPGTAPGAAGLFDRSLDLTGAGALATLASMRIAVVGAGGTGSLMAELLARAGAGEIIIFDFDPAEVSNLNR